MNLNQIFVALHAATADSVPKPRHNGGYYNPHQRKPLKGWQRENNRKGNRWAKR